MVSGMGETVIGHCRRLLERVIDSAKVPLSVDLIICNLKLFLTALTCDIILRAHIWGADSKNPTAFQRGEQRSLVTIHPHFRA